MTSTDALVVWAAFMYLAVLVTWAHGRIDKLEKRK